MEGGTPQLAEAESLSSGNSDAEDTHLATATTTAASGYFTPPTGSPAVSPLLSLSNDSSCHSALQSESGSRASSEEVDLSQVLPAHADALAPANDNPDCDDVESILREQLHNHRLLLQRLTSAKENQSRGCDSRTMSLPPTDDGHGSSPASAAVNHLQQQQDTFNYYQLQQMQNMLFPVDVSNAQQLYPVDVSNAQQLFPVDVSNAQQLYPVDVSNAQQLFPTDANNAQQLFPTDASNAQQLFPVDVANSQLISQSTNFALIANLELHRRRLQSGYVGELDNQLWRFLFQQQLSLQQQLHDELTQQLTLQEEHADLKRQLEEHKASLKDKPPAAADNKSAHGQPGSHTDSAVEGRDSEVLQPDNIVPDSKQKKLLEVEQNLVQLHGEIQRLQHIQNAFQAELLKQPHNLHQQLQVAQMQQNITLALPNPNAPLSHLALQPTNLISPTAINQQMAQFLSQPDLLQQTPHHVQLLAETHARRIQLQQQQQQQQSVLVNPNIVVPTHPQTSLYGSENKTLTVQAPSAGGTSVLTSGTGANNLTNGKGKKKKLHTPGAAPPFTQQNLSVQQMQALAANKNQPMHALQTTPYNNCQLNQQAPLPAVPQQLNDQLARCSDSQQLYMNYYMSMVQAPTAQLPPTPSPSSPHVNCEAQVSPPVYSASVEVDAQTESNHDTALTLACAGGHADLVSLLLSRGAEIEHRDKKGFTPLILASTAGHMEIVEMLLDSGSDIEAQSDRTKDTALSLACSGGRLEVVEVLLQRGANKEHRNVSDYTPLSLAASGGYVQIIKLLLQYAAEINSRTGSKLGISPLMLAAMNGHTPAVKVLLDMGSDINAQIETNRNTALTLACFQGRHEVVSLLVDRKANIEHRAKTGLTPLMEAASGGYVDVGRVLIDKGADVNASPVPSSKDTALTIAADKGHVRFIEMLIVHGASVDMRNKKGNSPLWLACNGQ